VTRSFKYKTAASDEKFQLNLHQR